MLTQCPNCQTTFRITSEILRVAHGQVRCGRCHTQFDALQRLIEEDPAERQFDPPPPAQIEVEEPEAQEEITLEGRHIEISGTYRVMDNAAESSVVRREITQEWVEIDDAGDDDIDASDGIVVQEDDAAAYDDVVETRENREARRYPRTPVAISDERRAHDDAADELDSIAPRRSRPTALVWKLLAAPLVLLLGVQAVHHYRSELVRHPRVGPPLAAAYAALGIPLVPNWHLHEYEIKQWGVLSDPTHPGTLKVRASITNRARFPQPYPLLRLVLEDRWGDQVRAREFEPAEYLDPGTVAGRLMMPGQPTNATITIVDPGPDAEGFRFDVCLRGTGPAVVCAADVPR